MNYGKPKALEILQAPEEILSSFTHAEESKLGSFPEQGLLTEIFFFLRAPSIWQDSYLITKHLLSLTVHEVLFCPLKPSEDFTLRLSSE